jgi:hypothetical protein
LLKQVREWGTTIKKNDEDTLYLAKSVQPKSIPIELPRSADHVRTIKEAVEYFEIINKEYIIHIIIEQTELKQLKKEFSDKSPSKHLKREDAVNIKKEHIKKEKDTEIKLVPRTESTL